MANRSLLDLDPGDQIPRVVKMTADQVWSHSLREIEEFFAIYKKLEGKEVQVHGWRGVEEAKSLITGCRERYLEAQQAAR